MLCDIFSVIAFFYFQRAGAVFPQRSEIAAPVFTPPQTHPLASYPQNLRDPDTQQETAESSAESEFPTLRYIYSFFSPILTGQHTWQSFPN